MTAYLNHPKRQNRLYRYTSWHKSTARTTSPYWAVAQNLTSQCVRTPVNPVHRGPPCQRSTQEVKTCRQENQQPNWQLTGRAKPIKSRQNCKQKDSLHNNISKEKKINFCEIWKVLLHWLLSSFSFLFTMNQNLLFDVCGINLLPFGLIWRHLWGAWIYAALFCLHRAAVLSSRCVLHSFHVSVYFSALTSALMLKCFNHSYLNMWPFIVHMGQLQVIWK